MLKKVSALLICAVMLLMSAPAKALAQTIAQPAPATGGNASDPRAKPKRDLKTALAELTAKTRVDTVTEADIKRVERKGLQDSTRNDGGLTRKEKILIYSIVAGMIVLAVVIGIKTGKGGHAFCDSDPTDPECIGPYP